MVVMDESILPYPISVAGYRFTLVMVIHLARQVANNRTL